MWLVYMCINSVHTAAPVHPQIRVVAFDTCNPVQKSVAFVTLTVRRNEARPTFPEEQYEVNIPETKSVGEILTHVEAFDSDQVLTVSESSLH